MSTQWWTAADLHVVEDHARVLIEKNHSERLQMKAVAPAKNSRNYEVGVVKMNNPAAEDWSTRISKTQLDDWLKAGNVAAIQEHLDRQLQMCFAVE